MELQSKELLLQNICMTSYTYLPREDNMNCNRFVTTFPPSMFSKSGESPRLTQNRQLFAGLRAVP